MKFKSLLFIVLVLPFSILAQDLSEGLLVNDLTPHPMQPMAKPAYLSAIVDPSFGTTIRRITDAENGSLIVPMYSTVQAWNADESFMILYDQSQGHILLDGMTYEFVRVLDDIDPYDLEQIFWDFNDPNVFYYPDFETDDFIRYTLDTQTKETLFNLVLVSGCTGNVLMGNDIQMMSWDSDVVAFRCDEQSAYSYRISTGELTTIDIFFVEDAAPGVGPSGNRYYHRGQMYNADGAPYTDLNVSSTEHSCIGKLTSGNDAYFAVAFGEGPQGGCLGDILAHDMVTGECMPIISQEQGYDYTQSGVHISALAHKNTEGGWVAASMMGYDQDGQELLDQELVIAKAEAGNIKVCRIGHHRSDEDDFDYFGEPHAVISPTGTRVLFGSDWSGAEDGQSVDSYVVELPVFESPLSTNELMGPKKDYRIFPNPVSENAVISIHSPRMFQGSISIFNSDGREVVTDKVVSSRYDIDASVLNSGVYYFRMMDDEGESITGQFVKE